MIQQASSEISDICYSARVKYTNFYNTNVAADLSF